MKRRTTLAVISGALAAAGLGVIAGTQPAQPVAGINQPTAATKSNAPAKQLWHCGMHPQVIQDHPGFCPICHMALTPIGHVDHASTTGPGGGTLVTIDPAVVQNMGVRTAKVTRSSLQRSVRAVGVINLPEPAMHDVNLRVGGWVEKLYADQEGMGVVEGQPLFDLYSPDLQVAEQELIGAVKASKASGGLTGGGEEGPTLVESAKHKLALLGIAQQDVDAIAKADKPPATTPVRSPATGHIEDKTIVQGSAVAAMTKIMRIVDHSHVWLEVQVYPNQIDSVKGGLKVRATVEGMPQKEWDGSVSFIYPHLDHMSRTLMLRITLANPGFHLRPGMYATAEIALDPVENAVQVPREAVIDTGDRQIAFVDAGDGHFEARRVQMGVAGEGGTVQILSGLAPGETVVTSGQFLLDAESRTIEAIAMMGGGTAQASANAPAPAPATAPATQSILSVAYCPMAKASWLQRGSDIANPYLGTAMPDCGSVQNTVNAPADARMAALLKAYLDVEKSLSADRLDSSAQTELLARAKKLPEKQYAALRIAAAKLSEAQDLQRAREAFHAVSDQLVSALSKNTGEGAKQ